MSFYQFKSSYSYSKINGDKTIKNQSFEYLDNNKSVSGELEQVNDSKNKFENIYKKVKEGNNVEETDARSVNNSNWLVQNTTNNKKKKEYTEEYNKYSNLFNNNILENNVNGFIEKNNFLEFDKF